MPTTTLKAARAGCSVRATTAASLQLPGSFVPQSANGPRPPGAPKFFMPGAAQAAAAGTGWGQPGIPEAASQQPPEQSQQWGQPAAAQHGWGVNGVHTSGAPSNIPEVPVGQDLYTSYGALEPASSAGPPAARAGSQPHMGSLVMQSQPYSSLQDGEMTEIQL